MPAATCCLWSFLNPATVLPEAGCLVCCFWSFWEGLWCRPVSDAWCTIWLPLLGLVAHRKDKAVLQGQLLLVVGPGAAQHMYLGTLQTASAFLVGRLPVRLIHRKRLWLVGLHEGRCHSDFREGGGYDPHPKNM